MLRRAIASCSLLALVALPLAALDGQIDATFGNGTGAAILGSPSLHLDLAAGVLLPDGRVYAVGSWDNPSDADAPDLLWARVNADGGSWAAFNCEASFLVPGTVESSLAAAHVTGAGKILVAGRVFLGATPTISRALVAQLDPTDFACQFDEGFNGTGWRLLQEPAFCAGSSCEILDTGAIRFVTGAVAAERTVVLLKARVNSLVARYFLVGLTAAGAYDPGFGSAGWAEVTAPGVGTLSGGGRTRMDVDARGRIWVVAARHDPADPLDLDTVLARFTAAGEPDATFDGDGLQVVDDDPATDALAEGIAVHSDLALSVFSYRLTDNSILQCHSATGTEPWSCSAQVFGDDFAGVAAQGDGRDLYAFDSGTPSASAHVRRSLPPFLLDPDFGADYQGGTVFDLDLGGGNDETPTALTLGDGRPLVFGVADSAAGTRASWVLRLTNSYIFTDGFEAGTFGAWSGGAIP